MENSLTINVRPQTRIILEEKARADGKELVEFVEDLIEKQASRPNFRDLFADVRRNISMSDDDLEKEIDAAIKESRETEN